MEEDCKFQKPWHCTLRLAYLAEGDTVDIMQGHGHPAPIPTQSLSPATHTYYDGLKTDYDDDPES